jgi:hypothetical protein
MCSATRIQLRKRAELVISIADEECDMHQQQSSTQTPHVNWIASDDERNLHRRARTQTVMPCEWVRKAATERVLAGKWIFVF